MQTTIIMKGNNNNNNNNNNNANANSYKKYLRNTRI